MNTAVPMDAPALALAPADVDHLPREHVRCPACAASAAAFFIAAEDDLTGRPGRFRFVTCGACGLVYQQPRLTLAGVKPFYDGAYIAHQRDERWGLLAPLFKAAMGSLDRAKMRLVRRAIVLDARSRVLDVGCGAGTFLQRLRSETGARVAGVDFVDLSDRPAFREAEFHHGLFYDQAIGRDAYDLITMWHFLEHDYDPLRSLVHARNALTRDGRLLIEVPRLDSLSFRLFGNRWPGLQAPQHTVLFDRTHLEAMVKKAGLESCAYFPYGAFPPYFYLFCGVAFRLGRGRGLDLEKAKYAYFAGHLLTLPIQPLLTRLNFAMQTIVCRRPA
jgi:SAM-dependent methyltransferase